MKSQCDEHTSKPVEIQNLEDEKVHLAGKCLEGEITLVSNKTVTLKMSVDVGHQQWNGMLN